jgi:type IX secretion system PorP/SprF family membrane protein
MKRLLLLSILFLSLDLVAQQIPKVTNFSANEFVFNPAVAGARDSLCATLLYRGQWIGFKGPDSEGAPVTELMTVHSQVKRRFGLGVDASINEEGFIRTTAAHVSAAYHLKLKQDVDFGLGISTGILQKLLDSKWRPRDPADTRLPSTSGVPAFDAALGVRFSGNNWHIGASSQGITQSKINWGTAGSFAQTRTYWLTAGYNWYGLAGGRLEIAPSALLVTDFAKHSLNANLLATYKKSVYAGMGYSSSDISALSIMAGVYIEKKFCIGYAYGIATRYASIFGGTHEIMLQFTQDLKVFR